MKLFALSTRGLEQISAAEMGTLAGLQLETVAYRRVECHYTGDLAALLELRTVDDVFVHLASWNDVGHERRFLAEFAAWSQTLSVEAAVQSLSRMRAIPEHPLFSVTVNFVGKRNYSAPEVKAALAEGIAAQQADWRYVEDDGEANLNIRLFIERETALLGLRVGRKPLHRRDYKAGHSPGSLKPTVAASMLQLAGVKKGETVIDPFCGSATILIEAADLGAEVLGGDLDRGTLDEALRNVRNAQVNAGLFRWDARRLPLRAECADYVVTNMPWGRQVQVDTDLASLYAKALAELQRVTRRSGRIVVLSSQAGLLPAKPETLLEISLYGQRPKLMCFGV